MNDLCSQDVPTADRNGSGWALPRAQVVPEHFEVPPGTLALLADFATDSLLVRKALDAHLVDWGHDPSRKWRLVLTGALIVADDDAIAGAPGPA